MIYVNTKQAIKQANRAYDSLSPKVRRQATARALNRTILAVRTAASKEIRARYNIRAKDIKPTMSKRTASALSLEASLRSKGKGMPLIKFKAAQTRKGVRATIKRGSRQSLPGAFIATMKSGHRGVFARAQYKSGRLVSRRKRINPSRMNDLPITELKTVAVPSALANDIVTAKLRDVIAKRFPANLERELNFRKLRAAGLA